MRLPSSLALPMMALLMAAVGCADPYGGRMEVSGSVKLVGQPLKEGSIIFIPLENQGTQSGGAIQNGEYKLPRKDGLKPGKYLVQITAGDGKTPADEEAGNPGGSSNIVSFDLIPEEWNVQSDKQVEVKSSGPNVFEFSIPKINTPKKKR